MLCTRGKYWSVWLIFPTMIFSQHFTAWLLQHQQMWKTPEETDQPLALWPGLSSPDIFSWLRPWPRPCQCVPRRLPRADCKYQLITEIPALSDGLVPSKQRSTKNAKYPNQDSDTWLCYYGTKLYPHTICRLLQNDYGDWYPQSELNDTN